MPRVRVVISSSKHERFVGAAVEGVAAQPTSGAQRSPGLRPQFPAYRSGGEAGVVVRDGLRAEAAAAREPLAGF
jgi:hypothetical protein